MNNSDFSFVFKKKMLELFDTTVKFFQKHNLQYCACGGTALGAIRHKGIIPWDDDIDLYMPRRDYIKLMDLTEDLKTEGCSFVCFEKDKDYYLPFGKIVDNNSSIWEVKEYPYMLGVYIDIFPLDSFDMSDNELLNLQNKYLDIYYDYQSTQQNITFRTLVNQFHYRGINKTYSMIHGHLNEKVRMKYYNIVLDYLHNIQKCSGPKSLCVTQWKGRVFKTEWFDEPVLMPFEDTLINVPGDYNSYLTLLYGDYMTPPPPQKRNFKHEDVRYYVNLREKLSIEEAQKRLERGENLVY